MATWLRVWVALASAVSAGAVRVQVARGRMIQPAYGECIIGPSSRLLARELFQPPPPDGRAEAALADAIYSSILGRYGRSNVDGNTLVFANDEVGNLIGICGLEVERRANERRLLIANLAVEPRARGRGLGRRLVRRCEDLARGLGARQLYLKVEKTNTKAMRLYRRLGYTDIGTDAVAEIPRGITGPFGGGVRWVRTPLVIMRKDLGFLALPELPSLSFGTPFLRRRAPPGR